MLLKQTWYYWLWLLVPTTVLAGPIQFQNAPIGNPLAEVHNQGTGYADIFVNWIVPLLIVVMIAWQIYKFARSDNFMWESLIKPVVALILLIAIRQLLISLGFTEVIS